LRTRGLGLFSKILLWFFGTVLIVAAITAVMIVYLQQSIESEHLQNASSFLQREAQTFIQAFEMDPAARLSPPATFPSRIWLFDASGTMLIQATFGPGFRPPLPYRDGAPHPHSPSLPDCSAPVPPEDSRDTNRSSEQARFLSEIASAAVELLRSNEPQLIFSVSDEDIVGKHLISANGNHYAALLHFKPRPFPFFFRWVTKPGAWLRLLLLTGVVTLLCRALAQYLVWPVLELQNMSRSIAAGNFQKRLPESLTTRSDELGRLACDFNLLAEGIEASLKGQKQLLRDVSHELRSPLARVRVCLELLRSGQEEAREGLITKMERDVDRLNELIQQILDLSRLDQHRSLPLEKSSFDLVDFTRHTVADSQFEAELGQKSIQAHLPAEPIPVLASREFLRRALENVLRNAVRYTPPQSVVRIELQRSSQTEVVLKVADQGPGAAPENLPRLFDPFFRCQEDRARDSGGIGLGLAIVRKAVEAHDGSVTARNLDPNGLEIEIRLPTGNP